MGNGKSIKRLDGWLAGMGKGAVAVDIGGPIISRIEHSEVIIRESEGFMGCAAKNAVIKSGSHND